MHLRQKAAAPETSQQLVSDVATIAQAWGATRRRFRRKGFHVQRQLHLGSSFVSVPKAMKNDPAWLKPFRRSLRVVDVRRLFPSLNRSEGAPEPAAHQALMSEVIRGIQQREVHVEHLFADERWRLVRSSAPRRIWLSILASNGFPCRIEEVGPCRVDPVLNLIEIGQFADAD